jgi:signal transduction histidine kinase
LLKGTVTHADRAAAYLQDEFGAARVEFAEPGTVSVGDGIEASGFPDWGEPDGLVLRNAVFRTRATGAAVAPVSIGLLEAADGHLAGQLVRVRAVVIGRQDTSEGVALDLEADKRVFRAVLAGVRDSVGSIPQGSLVEITGICVPSAGPLRRLQRIEAMAPVIPVKLLLRGASDLVVIRKPSWWVVQRALLVVGFLVVAAVAALIWIHRLRRRVAQRTAELRTTMDKLEKEARRSATLAERDRLAGEIHDSLEQGLNGLMLQLESTAGLESCPPEIRSGLQLACNMASFSRTEVQNAVWELQSPMLEDLELPAAVENVMRQIVPEAIHASVSVEGTARRLPSKIEHHLLRVAQEAINNAVKHASAHALSVVIAYGADSVVLSITDDGCGFDPAGVRLGGLGHFGLRSLRSRVARIGATIEIVSAPGRGTTIRVHVPASAT